MNLAVSVQSDWDYLRVCFSDWPFWAIIYFLLNCAFKLKHWFKKSPPIPWDSEEFSQVIWPKQSFNFTFNFTENSLESERYSKLDRIRVHFGHTSKAPKQIKTGRKRFVQSKVHLSVTYIFEANIFSELINSLHAMLSSQFTFGTLKSLSMNIDKNTVNTEQKRWYDVLR